MEHSLRRNILVFLSQSAARLLATKLNEMGYAASTASSVPDLRRALNTANYHLVITTRPEIDVVRAIMPLPVVNLEVFFHSNPQEFKTEKGAKLFDANAFLARVKALTDRRPKRENGCNAPPLTHPTSSVWSFLRL